MASINRALRLDWIKKILKTRVSESEKVNLSSLLRLQVGFAFFAFILIGANDGAVGVLLPSLQAHYDVNKATVGLLFLTMTCGYLVGAFNSGLLVERLGERLFLVLGVGMFLVGVVTVSLMPPFGVVLAMLLPLGFGVAIIDAGLNAYIAGLPRNTALLNYLHAFYGTGALLGPVIASGILAVGWGWNSVYVVWVGMGLVLLMGFGAFFRKRNVGVQEGRAKTQGNVLVSTLKLGVVWIVAIFLIFYVGTEHILGSWSYSFLTEERHGSTLLSGWTVSGYWLGLTLGRLVMAQVVQRVGSRRLIEGCLVGVVVGVLLVWVVPEAAVAAFGLFLVGMCLGPIFPTAIALMSRLVPARILPSAVGFLASMGSVGTALFPWLAGNLAQRVGLWSLLPYTIGLTGVMLVLWFVLMKSDDSRGVGVRGR